ncbi:MAG: putative metal-binding motif-containing protein [Xanthomarina sp.]
MKTILKLSLLTIFLIAVACKSDDDASCTEQIWYLDADGDTFGNPLAALMACTQPLGYVSNNLDFDDSNATAYPGAEEICDGIDNNGDGIIDGINSENCAVGEVCENGACVPAVTYYLDVDGDGYGDANNSIAAGSTAPLGYVSNNTDCDDSNPSIHPGAWENPTDGIDNNCNGYIDEILCTSDSDCSGFCVDQGDGIFICQ